MKKCPNCFKEFNDTAISCDDCGSPLQSVQPASPHTEEQQITSDQQTSPADNMQNMSSNAYREKNPNKKYIVLLIIASIIILILLCSKCSPSERQEATNATTANSPVIEATDKPTSKPTEKPIPTLEPTPAVKEFIKENYGYIDYNELARNPDSYIGKSLTYSGKVIQVIEGDTETQHRIAVNGNYDKVIYVGYPKSIVTSRILEDDYVTIYGMSLGLYSYQSTMGGQITIPAIYLDRIELSQ